jgi:hypothetical protein
MGREILKTKAAQHWLPLFMDFVSHLTIDSKETGVGPLIPYGAQMRFLEEICKGLDQGVRHFVVLKARQLGISTISIAADLFWLMVHDGLQGALICDTEGNRDKFRILLERYIQSLPKGLRVGIRKHNRNNLVLNNGSVLDYLVAGTRKTSGGLGRSRALNFVHATECSSWGSVEGVASLIASLAQRHPDRLYIFESTARGFNLFHDMWIEAAEDKFTQKQIFIGWWSKEDYAFPAGSPEYQHYWDSTLDDEEARLCEEVEQRYRHRITPEQIAWHRWMRTVKISDDLLMNQEYPWTEDEAFRLTGRSFFPLRRISDDQKFLLDAECPFKGYTYYLGDNFLKTRLEGVTRAADADLRIWEEPIQGGIYVMGVDPAFGRSDNKDRHVIEVFRCFADKIVQVAEYATYVPETYQITWVMAHLAGAYGRYGDLRINLEVSGPGYAIMQELRHLKQLLDGGYLHAQASDLGLEDVFSNVRWYLYHRPDSMGSGYVYGWKTNADNKLTILNQFRDSYAVGAMRLRSVPLLTEMQTVVQEGSSIEGSGSNKDDRVFATALANKAWIEWWRPSLIANNVLYETTLEAERIAQETPQATMMSYMVTDFFRRMEDKREQIRDARAWQGIVE